jgi:LysM repeat protein
MSRRDTIIVAVLINAGLLIILFASALKSNDGIEMASQSQPEKRVIDLSKEQQSLHRGGDEVDRMIKQFTSLPTVEKETAVVVVVPETPAVQVIKDPTPIAKQEEFSTPMLAGAHSDSPLKVVVNKGDVLAKIAKKHGTSVDAIMKLNHLPDTRLKIGQVLNLPEPQKSSKTEEVQLSSEIRYYTVKQGDNPWTIAVKNHMKVDELLRLNQLNEEKARHLKPGDQLRIR